MERKAEKTDDEIKEQLLVQKMGYLRLPKRVRDEYGNPKDFPNPDVTAHETSGKLIVTYEFDLKKLPKGSGKDEKDSGSEER